MYSVAVFYFIAVICSARWSHTLPLYSESSLEPQPGLIQKLVSEVGPNTEGEQTEVNDLYPLLMQHNGDRESWNKGAKESAADSYTKMIEDLREAVLKLAAADKLRSEGFLRSEQNMPKTNKRACFWKYCVTN